MKAGYASLIHREGNWCPGNEYLYGDHHWMWTGPTLPGLSLRCFPFYAGCT